MKKDLATAMQLSAENLHQCLNKDCRYLPFWLLEVSEDYHANYRFYRSVHNIGRWWDALLRLEAATDYRIPEYLEEPMLQNLKDFYDNPDHICIEPEGIQSDMPIPFDLHSLREGLLALCGLIQYRPGQRDWALDTAHKMLQTVDRLIRPDGTLDIQTLDYCRSHPEYRCFETPTHCHGRFIEPLIYYYELSGDSLAYQLADRLAQWHYEHSINPDGTMDGLPAIYHAHSYLGTLRGLFLFGKLSGQRRYIDRVQLCYQQTVMKNLVKDSGFSAHDIGADRGPEPATAGDTAQLALWFALDGCPEYLDDAEKLIRARLLPSIVWESPALYPDGEGNHDRWTNLTQRIIGAFGGMQTLPHGGKCATTDVTAACLHTLTDIYNHIVVESESMTQVLFHFDYASSTIQITSHREKQQASLTVQYSGGKLLQIRIPGWVNRDHLHITVDGQTITPQFVGPFLQIDGATSPMQIHIQFILPQRDIIERTDGTDYHIRFWGDEIVGITPNVDFYPLYPTLP